MHSAKDIRVIFFDAAGTLFHLPRGVGWHYRDVAWRHGLALDESTLNHAFRAAWKRTPAPAATRTARPDDDRGWWRALVEAVLDDCGVHGGFDRAAYFDELYDEFTKPGIWELYPETREILEQLRSRYVLGVISNFDGRLRAILDHLGIASHFAHLAISSEVGADKPDPWIFERALAMVGVEPAVALHIGDDPVCDWEGAAAVGLQTFCLDRPHNSLRDLDLLK